MCWLFRQSTLYVPTLTAVVHMKGWFRSTRFVSRAAVAVTVLKVDPGTYRAWSARLYRGCLGSDCRLASWSSEAFGSKNGREAIASTAPERGSRATMAPSDVPS